MSWYGKFPAWRTNKSQNNITKYVKSWWWCRNNVYKDKLYGLYMEHPPENHNEWKVKRVRSEQISNHVRKRFKLLLMFQVFHPIYHKINSLFRSTCRQH